MIICGFPGIGKSTLAKKYNNVIDIDVADYFFNFNFPYNYIDDILKINYQNKIVLVSAHKIIVDLLHYNKCKPILVYPEQKLKKEYMKRYKKRGQGKWFQIVMDLYWNVFYNNISKLVYLNHYILKENQYLSDIIDDIYVNYY